MADALSEKEIEERAKDKKASTESLKRIFINAGWPEEMVNAWTREEILHEKAALRGTEVSRKVKPTGEKIVTEKIIEEKPDPWMIMYKMMSEQNAQADKERKEEQARADKERKEEQARADKERREE